MPPKDEDWVSLREYFEAVITEKDKRIEQKFFDIKMALDAALISANTKFSDALATQKEAVLKAEVATDKRFDSVNEFRNTLKDQQDSFVPRSEYNMAQEALKQQILSLGTTIGDRLAALEKYQYSVEGRTAVADPMFTDLLKEVKGLRESRAQGTGKTEGVTMSWGLLIGAIGLAGAIIGIFIFFNSNSKTNEPKIIEPKVIYVGGQEPGQQPVSSKTTAS